MVATVGGFFNDLWRSKETERISKTRLNEAKKAWDERPRPMPSFRATTLLEACRLSPAQFTNVYVAMYDRSLSKAASAEFERVRTNSVDDKLGADSFRHAFGYQFERAPPGGSWLVDFRCLPKAKVWGCARVPDPALRIKVEGENDLTLAVRGVVTVDGKRLPLAAQEKLLLESNARRLWDQFEENVVPLPEILRVLERRTR
jgi:hypothetical protein